MKNLKENKIVRKILILGIIILSILSINGISFADDKIQTDTEAAKTWSGKMPQNSIAGSTGMFPQYYIGTSGRFVNLPSSRHSWTRTGSWQSTMEGDVVYCAEHGAYVRYGNYDPAIHYLVPGQTTIQNVNVDVTGVKVGNTLSEILKEIRSYYAENLEGSFYTSGKYSSNSQECKTMFGVDVNKSFPGGENAIGYYVTGTNDVKSLEDITGVYFAASGAVADARSQSESNMKNIFEKLSHSIWPSRYSTDIDYGSYTAKGISATEGPEFVVLETSVTANDRYTTTGSGSYSNDQKAYILTSLENVYGEKGEYGKKYTLNDMQTAYWLALGQNPSKGTSNGRTLYKNSEKYAEFASKEYKASINTSLTQVIADRGSQSYIVGPFTLNYQDYTAEDISYVKSLSINNGSLIYDETHSDFEIILEQGGTEVPGANGMKKHYPKAGEKFFIKFSASSIGYATSINLSAQFEYISGTNIDYTQLDTLADIWKYYGYCELDGTYGMEQGTVDVYLSYLKGYEDEEPYNPHEVPDKDEEGNDLETTHIEYDYRTIYLNEPVEKLVAHFVVYQPYIKQGDTPEQSGLSAQTLTVAENGKREYKIESKDVTIDLSMELGGYAFEDNDGGKEDTSDGTYGSGDKKISNMPVTLYLYNGSEIASTKTNENGEYRFSGLNAMYQYYVKFTYNGQYYQPTTYSSSNTWGGENWQVNSNAKDRVSERENYNIKFEKIGSSPANYESKGYKGVGIAGYNKTYTRLDLLGYTLQENGEYAKTKEAVIDEFGNLTGKGDESRIQYVKDCMMNAYTNADASAPEGLYPVPSRFLIADGYKWALTPKLLASHGIGGISILYPTAYYINLGLDSRQQSDLAVKKDIEKVTLEINGQTHTYTYDTLENKENAENEWDINVRLSDAYYSASYSREIYKADYIYKASMYGDTDKNGDGIGDTFGKSSKDELEVYVTYKIMVRNQAMSIQTRVDELVDYYDQDLEYIDERSYIEIKRGDNQGKYSVKANTASRYGKNTQTTINGYDNLYVTGLDDKYLTAGQTAYIYLTFKVKKDSLDGENWVKLDEDLETAVAIGVGKENIAEINGYSTRYASGTQVPNIGDVSFKPAGIVDHDSNPGNVGEIPGIKKDLDFNTTEGKKIAKQFEDDTDKAPNIRIILDRNDNNTRTISGSVWEDTRNNTIDLTTIGDGERTDKETLINGITIQLVEIMENGTEYVWREFGNKGYSLEEFKKLNPEEQVVGLGGTNTIGKGTGSGTISSETPIINYKNLIPNYEFSAEHNGQYAFKSFMPGKYVVRFIYGDTVRTVTPSSLSMGGLNEKSYNGQDYKSTTYQKDIAQENKYIWTEKATWNLGEEDKNPKVLTEVTSYDKVNADHNERTSVPTLDASGNLDTTKQKGYYYDITASDAKTNVSDAKDIGSIREAVNQYSNNYGNGVTNYLAEVLASHKSDYTTMNDRNTLLEDLMENTKMTSETGLMVIELEYDRKVSDGKEKDFTYKIQNVDLGLEERPKAQLAIDKKVTNVKLTLADGSVLFDAKDTAQNVLWRKHEIYQTGYNTKTYMLDESKFASILNIRDKNKSKFGLIQLSMDEELMHGATIKITYEVTITNVGEVDYKDNRFYYTGKKSENAQIVTTRADQVIDYVANNLQFNASENSNWSVIQKDKLNTNNIKQDLVNSDLKKVVDTYNTIIQTEKLNKDLVPSVYSKNEKDYSTSVPLVLTQLITSENDTDDLTYSNVIEIVKTSNMLGRRNEYSVVGNQDATTLPQELDSDRAEVVKILPPFGNTLSYIQIAVIAIGAVGIIVIGIIFIKKKVLIK